MLEVPIAAGVLRQSVITRLGGLDTKIVLWWQTRSKGWFVTVEAPVGTVLCSARRLASNQWVLPESRTPEEWDDANLACIATSAADGEPAEDAFASTHKLVFTA